MFDYWIRPATITTTVISITATIATTATKSCSSTAAAVVAQNKPKVKRSFRRNLITAIRKTNNPKNSRICYLNKKSRSFNVTIEFSYQIIDYKQSKQRMGEKSIHTHARTLSHIHAYKHADLKRIYKLHMCTHAQAPNQTGGIDIEWNNVPDDNLLSNFSHFRMVLMGINQIENNTFSLPTVFKYFSLCKKSLNDLKA